MEEQSSKSHTSIEQMQMNGIIEGLKKIRDELAGSSNVGTIINHKNAFEGRKQSDRVKYGMTAVLEAFKDSLNTISKNSIQTTNMSSANNSIPIADKAPGSSKSPKSTNVRNTDTLENNFQVLLPAGVSPMKVQLPKSVKKGVSVSKSSSNISESIKNNPSKSVLSEKNDKDKDKLTESIPNVHTTPTISSKGGQALNAGRKTLLVNKAHQAANTVRANSFFENPDPRKFKEFSITELHNIHTPSAANIEKKPTKNSVPQNTKNSLPEQPIVASITKSPIQANNGNTVHDASRSTNPIPNSTQSLSDESNRSVSSNAGSKKTTKIHSTTPHAQRSVSKDLNMQLPSTGSATKSVQNTSAGSILPPSIANTGYVNLPNPLRNPQLSSKSQSGSVLSNGDQLARVSQTISNIQGPTQAQKQPNTHKQAYPSVVRPANVAQMSNTLPRPSHPMMQQSTGIQSQPSSHHTAEQQVANRISSMNSSNNGITQSDNQLVNTTRHFNDQFRTNYNHLIQGLPAAELQAYLQAIQLQRQRQQQILMGHLPANSNSTLALPLSVPTNNSSTGQTAHYNSYFQRNQASNIIRPVSRSSNVTNTNVPPAVNRNTSKMDQSIERLQNISKIQFQRQNTTPRPQRPPVVTTHPRPTLASTARAIEVDPRLKGTPKGDFDDNDKILDPIRKPLPALSPISVENSTLQITGDHILNLIGVVQFLSSFGQSLFQFQDESFCFGWLSEVIYDSSVNFLPLLKLYQSILNRLGPLNTESFLEVQERLYRYLQKYCTEPVLCTAWRDTDFPLISPTVHIETLWFLINQSSALLGDLEKEMKQSIGKLGIEYNGLIKEKGNLKKEEVSIRAKFSDVAHNADQQVQNEMADILKRLMNSIEEVNAKIQEQKNQIKRLNQILARIYKRDNPSFLGIDRHERGYWWLSSVLSATSENGELETIKNGRRCVGLLIESSYLNQKNHKSEFFFVKDYASLYSIRQAMCPFGKNEYALSKTLDLSLSVYLNHCKTLEPTKSNNVVDFLKEGTNSFTNWVQKMSAPKITERNALKYHEKFKEELVQVSNELFLSYGLEDLSKVTPFELSENVSIGHYRWMFQELVNMGLLPFFNVTKRNALKACKTFSSYFCWSSRQMKYFKAASLKLAQEQEKEENEKQLKLMKQKEKEKRITTAATPIKIVIDRPVIKPKPVRKSTVPDFIDPSIYEVEDESESKDSNDIENDVKSEGGDEIDDNYSNGSMHESRKRARRRSKRKRNAVDSISDSISSRTTTDSLIDTSTSRASRKRARRRAKRKAKAAESISDSISSKTTTDSLIESSTSEVSRKRSRRKPRKGKLPVDSSSIDSSINQSDRGKSDSSDDKLPEASESDDPLLSRKRQRNSKKRKRQKKNKRKLESENIKSVSASQSGFVLANTNTDELLYMISSDED